MHSTKVYLENLPKEDWKLICQTHDEHMRRGAFRRVYPHPDRIGFSKYFETQRYLNTVMKMWVEEGGDSIFDGGAEQFPLPEFLPRKIFHSTV
jgi:hypothetical protein